jgi:alkyldihydroxyacetonephosphate synthase
MAEGLKFWGWGREGEGPDDAALGRLAQGLGQRFGRPLELRAPPRIDEIALRPPRIAPPGSLREILCADPGERARHTYGRSYRDVVRALARDFSEPPDWVAFPRDESEVADVLDWCSASRCAVIPFGGGSSVVGGVEPRFADDAYAGCVSLDLTRLDRVLEVDPISRAAHIQAGILGPALEDALRPHGLTLRHYPQSFEFSTLGGWIATRSGGHFATRYTHIDEFVESLTALTPRGRIESRRLPGSGAGPSPDRLFLGSEGTLGVITEAWMRLQDRPRWRARADAQFASFEQAVSAVRALAQSGLEPANCRLLDADEAASAAGGSGDAALLLLAFESADHPLGPWLARGVEILRDHGGHVQDERTSDAAGEGGARAGAAGTWRASFVGAPYLRDGLVRMGVLSETFETAVTWDRFPSFHAAVIGAARDAVREECGQGRVTCRFTHVYPDGPAPYYTVLAPAERGRELEQWDAIKARVSDALIAHGGTITHHHAVGRDHQPWYAAEAPPLFRGMLAAAKRDVDPAGILNPGVLVDPG